MRLFVKSFLVFSIAAFYLAIVSWSVRLNELQLNAQNLRGQFKGSLAFGLVVDQAVCKLEAVVCLNALYLILCLKQYRI